jgi:hypothetical protein
MMACVDLDYQRKKEKFNIAFLLSDLRKGTY